MSAADKAAYLADVVDALKLKWPEYQRVNIVCDGHSVPAGYFDPPMVDSLNAYPHLLHLALKERFPFALMNVINTAIAAEHSEQGAARFDRVIGHRPDVVTIDYGLNDRSIGLERARSAWVQMIEAAIAANAKVILLTPTADTREPPDQGVLNEHAAQIRELAAAYGTGLVDSLARFKSHAETALMLDLMSAANHPNRRGHELVAEELLRWFAWG